MQPPVEPNAWAQEIDAIEPATPPAWYREGIRELEQAGGDTGPGLDWFGFASTYERAVGVLAGRLRQLPPRIQDLPPAVFLSRHVVELILKHLVRHGRELRNADPSDDYTHRLDQLWAKVRPDVERTTDATTADLAERLVDTLVRLDESSTRFRYPPDQLAPQAHMIPSCVDVEALYDAVMHFIDVMTVASDRLHLLVQHGYER